MLVPRYVCHPDPFDVIDRRTKPNRIRNRSGAGFEASGWCLVHSFFKRNISDHVAPALPRRHAIEDVGLAVNDADPRWCKHLVPGKDIKITIEKLHVHRHVRYSLRPVQDHGRAVVMGHFNHFPRWRHRTEGIGNLCNRNQARARPKKLRIFIEKNLAGIIDWSDAQTRAFFRAKHLPRHDIGMMFEPGDHDLIVFLDVPSPALSDQIDAFSGAATKYDLSDARSIQEPANLVTGALIGVS